jgi:hypothetical protein
MCLQVMLPDNHTALTGDLEVRLIGLRPGPEPSRLQLERATATRSFTVVAALTVANSTATASFPCGVITLGGRYRVVLLTHAKVGAHSAERGAQAPCCALHIGSAN